MGVACLKFRGETFAGGYKIAKFVKIFSLESFPLYSTYIYICIIFLDYYMQLVCMH